jgi:hypothetical protein
LTAFYCLKTKDIILALREASEVRKNAPVTLTEEIKISCTGDLSQEGQQFWECAACKTEG